MIQIAIHRSRESGSESILGPSLANRDSRDECGNGLRGPAMQSELSSVWRMFLKPLANRSQSL